MAKKVEGYIKLQIPAGKATPAPPVGPSAGPTGGAGTVSISWNLQNSLMQGRQIREIRSFL